MKAINLSIFICIIILSLFACYRDKLPEPTQSGNNTIGMKIDGQNWKPRKAGFFGPDTYGYVDEASVSKDGVLIISAGNSQFFLCVKTDKRTGKYYLNRKMPEYLLNNEDSVIFNDTNYCVFTTRFVKNTICLESYKLRDSLNSDLQITKFDTLHKIVSGVFSMNLYNYKDTLMKITEGRFDIKY